MIQIYTTNYTKASRLSNKGKEKSRKSDSGSRRSGFDAPVYGTILPEGSILKRNKDWVITTLSPEDYETRFREQINKLSDIYSFFKLMAKQAKGRDILLLCYEKKNAFCHRHILSDIIYERYGYRIKEL